MTQPIEYIVNGVISLWNLRPTDCNYNDPDFKVIDVMPSHFDTTDYVSLEELERFLITKKTDKKELLMWSSIVNAAKDISIDDAVDHLKHLTKQYIDGGYMAFDGERYYQTTQERRWPLSYLPNYLNLNREFLKKYDFNEKITPTQSH